MLNNLPNITEPEAQSEPASRYPNSYPRYFPLRHTDSCIKRKKKPFNSIILRVNFQFKMCDDLFFNCTLKTATLNFMQLRLSSSCLKKLNEIHASTYTTQVQLTSKGIEAFKK